MSVRVKSNRCIIVPRSAVSFVGWDANDLIDVSFCDGRIVLTKA